MCMYVREKTKNRAQGGQFVASVSGRVCVPINTQTGDSSPLRHLGTKLQFKIGAQKVEFCPSCHNCFQLNPCSVHRASTASAAKLK